MKIKINPKYVIIIGIIMLLTGIILFSFFSYKKHIKDKEIYYKNTINTIQKKYDSNSIINIKDKNIDKMILFYNKSLELKYEFDKYLYPEFIKENDLKNIFISSNEIFINIDKNIEKLNNLKKELEKYYDFKNLKKEVYIKDEDFILSNLDKNIFDKNIWELQTEYTVNISRYNSLKEYINNLNENNKLWYLNNDRIIIKTDDYKAYIDSKNSELNIPLVTQKEVIYIKGSKLPIMMYHGINNSTWGGYPVLFVQVNNFDNQMKYLKDNGYQAIFLSEIDKYDDFNKKIVITFDDGYDDLYVNAFPILKKYDIKANIFMISEFLNQEHYLTDSQLKEMSNLGLVEIGSHTKNHNWLTHIDINEAKKEIEESKIILENIIGKKIDAFAYPMGDHNDEILNIVKSNYKYAVTVERGKQVISNDMNPIHLKRIPVNRSESLTKFVKSIQ